VSLAIGTKLGPYEILAPLGAGGMGEVYRANDTRLDRVVALKMLPEALAALRPTLQRVSRSVAQAGKTTPLDRAPGRIRRNASR